MKKAILANYYKLLFYAVLFSFFAPIAHSTGLDMPADIQSPVTTEFADYVPNLVDVVPSVKPYIIAEDFSNIANFNQFQFTGTQKDLLRKNGFVAVPSSYKAMYEIYNDAQKNNSPIFVTTDALLHTFHEQFGFILRDLESEIFYPAICELTHALVAASQAQTEQTTDARILDAIRRNTAYFAIAAKLLQSDFAVPESVADVVNAELQLIQAHTDFTLSPLFVYAEDYSQYVPRGHYTLSESLQKYFTAMMWFGRMTFHNRENLSALITNEIAERETIQALLITQLMNGIRAASQTALDVWECIYQPTVFLVGQSDDLTLLDYTAAARAVYGDDFASLPVDRFGDTAKLAEFMNYPTRTSSQISPEFWGSGFRFMGQRFIPDSDIFYQLYSGIGGIPSGLEIVAVFGSERAREILTAAGMYKTKHEELRIKYTALDAAVWAQNVYWNWLYCLMPILAIKGDGFPTYMQSAAWRDKDLACALGSWAELRHDTILYAKQSYAASGIHIPHNAYETEFVEPNPWAFARLGALCRYLKDGLQNLNLLSQDFQDRLNQLQSLSDTLKTIAEKELAGTPISIEERRFIRTIGQPLTALCFDMDQNKYLGDLLKDDMAVIADVHTDPFLGQCLEVGAGYPLTIYVAIGSEDNLSIAVGSAFSYYEFAQPLSDRLTDEAWRTLLQKQQAQYLDWTSSYLDRSAVKTPNASTVAPESGGTYFRQYLTLSSSKIAAGDPLEVRVTFEFYFPEMTPFDVNQTPIHAQIDMGGRLLDAVLLPDQSTGDPYDYTANLPTNDWPAGQYTMAIYSPTYLGIYLTQAISVEKTSSGIYHWMMY